MPITWYCENGKKHLNDKFASSKVARFLALDLFFSLFSYWFWHNEFIFVYFCLSTQCMVALDMRWYDIINCLHAKARSMHTIYIAHSILCVSTIPVLFSVVFFFSLYSPMCFVFVCDLHTSFDPYPCVFCANNIDFEVAYKQIRLKNELICKMQQELMCRRRKKCRNILLILLIPRIKCEWFNWLFM